MNAPTTLAIGPFAGARIALLVTNLLGDTTGEYFTDSVDAAISKARDVASYPDCVVWLFDTNSAGERTGKPNARIAREGVGAVKYQTL